MQRLRIVILLLLAPGCAFTPAHRVDQLCAEITEFANATDPASTHSVLLVGGWGGEVVKEINTHRCTHAGYPPGAEFCRYLLPNSSWEFGEVNAKRAFMCLDPLHRKIAIKLLKENSPTIDVTTDTIAGLEAGVSVTIRFGPGPREEHTSLEIVASRD